MLYTNHKYNEVEQITITAWKHCNSDKHYTMTKFTAQLPEKIYGLVTLRRELNILEVGLPSEGAIGLISAAPTIMDRASTTLIPLR